MTDHRSIGRHRTFLGAQIVFNDRTSTIDCVVRNLSQIGAKITVESSAGIPEQFDLVIAQNSDSRRARIVWKRKKEMGVVFL